MSDCISLCFQVSFMNSILIHVVQNLECKSLNYDRTAQACYIYSVGRQGGQVAGNPSTDFYQFNCESQFGGMALCTNDGIKFIVNTKQPYTGAIYAAERFSTCSKVVTNARTIEMIFPPPTISADCGTTLKVVPCAALCSIAVYRMASWRHWLSCRSTACCPIRSPPNGIDSIGWHAILQ